MNNMTTRNDHIVTYITITITNVIIVKARRRVVRHNKVKIIYTIINDLGMSYQCNHLYIYCGALLNYFSNKYVTLSILCKSAHVEHTLLFSRRDIQDDFDISFA